MNEKYVIEIKPGVFFKGETNDMIGYGFTENINLAIKFGKNQITKKQWIDFKDRLYGEFVKYNETSELHDLEALKDEYNQLMTEQELSEHNKKMFFRLFKKWSDDNDRLLKKMEKVDSQIAALEDKYGYDL